MADNPEKQEAENIVSKAGPRGRFVTVLYRFRMLGWWIALFLLAAVTIDYIIRGAIGPAVLVVSERGEFLGQIDFHSGKQRTNEQMLGGGMAFLDYKFSVSSSTVWHDFNNALTLMMPPLRERELAQMANQVDPVTKKPAMLAIEESKTRSWIEFDEGATAPRIESTKDGKTTARYRGKVVVVGAQRVEKRFDVTVVMVPTVRNAKNPLGIGVEAYYDN